MHGELFEDLYALSSMRHKGEKAAAELLPAAAADTEAEAGGGSLRDEIAMATQQGADAQMQMMLLQRPTWMSEEQAANGAERLHAAAVGDLGSAAPGSVDSVDSVDSVKRLQAMLAEGQLLNDSEVVRLNEAADRAAR